MEPIQEDSWLTGEGDRYHERNAGRPSALKDLLHSELHQVLSDFRARPLRVIDLGCGDGTTLRWLRDAWKPEYLAGVDPSRGAIQKARQSDSALNLWIGTIDRVPLKRDAYFDLVICHYVLHWVSRMNLVRALAEIDRCVSVGGLVSIADFSPDSPHAVPYKHAEGLLTYKADYPSILLRTGQYTSIRSSIHDHDRQAYSLSSTSSSRGIHTVMQKRLPPVHPNEPDGSRR
ncbi:MAG: class I SAM-dependent methyltransferase [Actinomycetota bacterium]|nr:class I SAM-dependent methyltransferase [Actinomycetota bacterium]